MKTFEKGDTVQAIEFFGDYLRGFYLYSFGIQDALLIAYISGPKNKTHKCKYETMISCRIVLTEKTRKCYYNEKI